MLADFNTRDLGLDRIELARYSSPESGLRSNVSMCVGPPGRLMKMAALERAFGSTAPVSAARRYEPRDSPGRANSAHAEEISSLHSVTSLMKRHEKSFW